MSRTENTTKNIMSNFLNQMLTVILGVITRKVFIVTLGETYLGVNGVFSNLISMLSLAELGVGTAITYKLYKPLEEKNEEQICKYMNFFRITYRIMGIVILIIGLACMPFLTFFIKDDTSFFNEYIIFGLYLMQSVSTYVFFAYKSAIIKADQKNYVTTNVASIVHLIQYFVQIILLFLLKSIYVYIGIVVIGNMCINVIVSIEVDKRYEYLKDNKKIMPSKQELREVFKDCYALSIYRVNGVVLKSIDNLVLSKYIGLSVVGLYSNYVLIYTHLKDFLTVLYNGILASLGNVFVSEDRNKVYVICKEINNITYLLFGVVSVGIVAVMNPLIQIIFGEKYLLSDSFVVMLAVEFYVYGVLKALATYRSAMGLFQQGKYRPLLGAIINVILSLLWVHDYGITGVIFATIIANISTYFIIDAYIIYKFGFQKSVKTFYIENLKNLIVISICAIIVKIIVNGIKNVVLRFFIGGILSIIITFGLVYFFNRNNCDFINAINRVKNALCNVLKRRIRRSL